MWLHNRLHTTQVQAYNEKTVVRDTGGITRKEDHEIVNLRILLIPRAKKYRQKEIGKFIEEILQFQVSKSELNKKSFSIEVGKTHVIKEGNDYRVVIVKDASYMNFVQLYDCVCKRMIPVEDLE